MTLSRTQTQIIQALRNNSREKLSVLAQRLNIPMSTLHDRLARLKKHSITCVSLVNFARMNMPIRAWIFIQAHDREHVQRHLSAQTYVNTLLSVHNGADFAAECVFASLKDYYDCIEALTQYGTLQEHPVVDVICQETARVHS